MIFIKAIHQQQQLPPRIAKKENKLKQQHVGPPPKLVPPIDENFHPFILSCESNDLKFIYPFFLFIFYSIFIQKKKKKKKIFFFLFFFFFFLFFNYLLGAF